MNWFDGVGVRPEFTRISRNGEGRRPMLDRVSFWGHLTHLHLRLDNGDKAMAHARPETEMPADGQELWLHWQPRTRFACDESQMVFFCCRRG